MTERFEAGLGGTGTASRAVAIGELDGRRRSRRSTYAGVRGARCSAPPTRSWPLRWRSSAAGGAPVFVDCNRDDLCLSFERLRGARLTRHRPRAAWLVHIGGHIAFDIERIAALCRAQGVSLLEDCAHAHGASWNGRRPGTWGDAGVYSLYATKTISTGEGGVLVSRDPELLEFARALSQLRQARPRRRRA